LNEQKAKQAKEANFRLETEKRVHGEYGKYAERGRGVKESAGDCERGKKKGRRKNKLCIKESNKKF
jgi:hypothetical protein